MSLKYLGDTLDIHGGGQDLVFPHHENEIAQSESFTGVKPFVKYWLHNGLVQLGEEKMSKSLGNLITIKEALQKYSADAIRIFTLSSYYRGPLTYSEEALGAAESGAERLRQAVKGEGSGDATGAKIDVEPYQNRFTEAMNDDFSTAQALAALFDLAREINRADEAGLDAAEAQQTLLRLANILGLTLKPLEKLPLDARPFIDLLLEFLPLIEKPLPCEAEPVIELLISTRNQLREAKQWQRADEIRVKLTELGIALEDTPKGTVWKYKR